MTETEPFPPEVSGKHEPLRKEIFEELQQDPPSDRIDIDDAITVGDTLLYRWQPAVVVKRKWDTNYQPSTNTEHECVSEIVVMFRDGSRESYTRVDLWALFDDGQLIHLPYDGNGCPECGKGMTPSDVWGREFCVNEECPRDS